MRLADIRLEQQMAGLTGLIGQFGIEDAFMIDVCADEIIREFELKPGLQSQPSLNLGVTLPYFDDAERVAIIRSGERWYRARHNTMTDNLRSILGSFTLTQGNQANCRYDVLIRNYDGTGRDLLIEAKPDSDRGSVRLAVGQLLDYRRFLPGRGGTDLAFLTIRSPEPEYIELLQDLSITAVWFVDESCSTLNGTGKAWSAISKTQSATK
jgi:hypothetical protein